MEQPKPKCTATTASGSPCGMPPIGGTDRCWSHATDPEALERRKAARAEGARAANAKRAGKPRPGTRPAIPEIALDLGDTSTPQGIAQALGKLAAAVAGGKVGAAAAREIRGALEAAEALLDDAGDSSAPGSADASEGPEPVGVGGFAIPRGWRELDEEEVVFIAANGGRLPPNLAGREVRSLFVTRADD